MGLLDSFTGGKADDAMDAMRRAEGYFTNLKAPTKEELTLPELQKYVEMGIITPSEAKAYLQERNAYEDMNIDQTGTGAQIEALNRLSQIADAGPDGTPVQQAQMANTLAKMRTSVGGQRGAIENAMAARGTPRALIQAALSNQAVAQDASQANLDAVNSQAATYQAALDALSAKGNLGNALQGQLNTQGNTTAAAANAMQQFNAANQTNISNVNANRAQEANTLNTQNKQRIGDMNTAQSNARTEYNAKVPQQMFDNEYRKAAGASGAATNYGNMQQEQGKQNAGITAGIINTGLSMIPATKGAQGFQAGNPTEDKFNQAYQRGYAHGGVVEPEYCNDGMLIPGEAEVPGDSLMNDNVPIMASPGEAVIPRTAVAQNPEAVDSLLGGEAEVIDARDVATLLKAMRAIRMGVAE